MPHLYRGRIVKLNIRDPQRQNPKVRPVVIIDTEPSAIPEDGNLHGIAITTQIGRALREECVALPYTKFPGQKVLTGLPEESEAVCSWAVVFTRSDIAGYYGLAPAKYLDAINDKIKEIRDNGRASATVVPER